MNSSDSAEEVVRISLEGMEVALQEQVQKIWQL